MISPDTPTSTHDDDLVRLKLKNYRMKTSAPIPQTPKATPATATHRSRHSRGPSLSSPIPPPQRTSPPLVGSAFRSPPQPTSSRPSSHHQRRSSVSNRRESLELMGGVTSPAPSSPPSDSELSGRESALRALEGRRPLSFVNGFEQVVVPEWKTPDVEARFDWAQASKALSSTPPAFTTASLAGKRDSFGKNMLQSSSLKDQLQTLLEEEEEEDDADVTSVQRDISPSTSTRPRPTTLRLDASATPLAVTARPGASADALARLRPFSLAPSLPSPALTPSPRTSALPSNPSTPGLEDSPTPIGLTSPSSATLRPLSLLSQSPIAVSSVMPSPQSAIFSARSGKLSSSGSSDSAKQVRRASTLSYRSSISSASGGVGGRASPAFSLSSSAAADHVTSKPPTPVQDRAIALQLTYLQQENATLLTRIAALDLALAEKEKQERASQDLSGRIEELESQVELLKGRVERERKETWSAKEVARRLSERVWEFERARDAGVVPSPPIPHSKATSAASSPGSLISGRSSGTSFWAGSASGGQSVGSLTDIDEPWGPAVTAIESLDVVQEEDEDEDAQEAEADEEEDEQDVDSAHGLGIEVSLLPESASSASGAQSGDSLRGSVSAFSMSSASTSEAEAQSLAVLEGMADGDIFFGEDQPADGFDSHEIDYAFDDEDVSRAESPASLPNPFSQNNSLDMLMAASGRATVALPATPTTPTPRTPTKPTPNALPRLPAAPAPAQPRHSHTSSQAAMASWKFPRSTTTLIAKREEENDVFFASLEEDERPSKAVDVSSIGRPMGKKERKERKKSIMRPWLGEDEEEDIQPVANLPPARPKFVLDPPPKSAAVRVSVRPRPPSISPSVAVPPPTWSLRSSAPSHGLPAPASAAAPSTSSSGFSFTKLTSVFASWVAPAPPPSIPSIIVSTPPTRLPAYYAPSSPTMPAPPAASRLSSPPRSIRKEDQPRPIASSLEKLDFRTTMGGQAACKRCVGPVIEL